MGRKQTIDDDTDALMKKLIVLRDPDESRKVCSEQILELLNYKKKDFIKGFQFNAFLIKAIDRRFGESMDADIALMAFGLLQGYEYEKIAITDRRHKYLEESDYLSYNPRSKVRSFIDMDSEGKKRHVENLRKKEDKRIEWLADFLLDQSSIEKFIEEIDDYIETVEGKQFVKLPEPSYLKNKRRMYDECTDNNGAENAMGKKGILQTVPNQKPEDGNEIKPTGRTLENFPSEEVNPEFDLTDNPVGKGHAKQEKRGNQGKPPSPEPKIPARIPWLLKLPVIFAGAACIVLISAMSILIYRYAATPPQIKEIDVKTEITVNPGGKENLELDVRPDGADWKELKSEIINEELVEITNDWWAVGLDGLGGKNSDDTAIVIWGGEAEPAIVRITVEKPRSRGNEPAWEQ